MKSEVRFKFTNRVVFGMVMQDEEICRDFLGLILPERIVREIRFPEQEHAEIEKTIFAGISPKSVRLDVLFEGEDAWYDIEMQVSSQKNLPKRIRYYHSMIDTHALRTGLEYENLKPAYVIFICLFDALGDGDYRYDIGSYVKKTLLPFDDGRFTIILNTSCPAEMVPEELRPFYAYVSTGEVGEDFFVEKLHQRVETANSDEGMVKTMTLEEEMRLEKRWAREEGLEEGCAEGLAKGQEEAKLAIACSLKKAGMKFEKIAMHTDLTLEEIESIVVDQEV